MLSKVQGFQTLRLNNNENSSAKNKDIRSSLVLLHSVEVLLKM